MFKKHRKLKITVTVFLILILVLSAGTYFFINGRLSKLNYKNIDKSSKATGIDEKTYDPNSELDKDFVNILLLGVDTRDEAKERGRSDSNIILTIDKKHNKIKMTSILRDTIMTMTGHGPMEGLNQDRMGHAYSYGGAPLAIKTVNENFNLNIKNYVKVDFFGLIKIIDYMGGVDLKVSEAEMKVANGYIKEMSEILNVKPDYFTKSGTQHLNGIKAVAYSRIRYVGNGDYGRTNRQRQVLDLLFKKISKKSILELPSIADNILPNIETSLSKNEILDLAVYVLKNGIKSTSQFRLPTEEKSIYVNKTYFVAIDKAGDTKKLHEFIFEGEDKQ